jgi:hypothetical protein
MRRSDLKVSREKCTDRDAWDGEDSLETAQQSLRGRCGRVTRCDPETHLDDYQSENFGALGLTKKAV